jgi:tetratricopeptide (TPR) repeat protein
MRHSVVALLALVFSLLLWLLCLTPVTACLNDRDSDEYAAEQSDTGVIMPDVAYPPPTPAPTPLPSDQRPLPSLIDVITGRFERNPPLYYQMRVQRIEQELGVSARRLPLYDDIAVALDRLGRDDEAIAWIEKKRARLELPDAIFEPDLNEHWYRYYANAGTFWAHRWLHNGANRSRIGEMKHARALIAEAIRRKPDAHFGRERYQLQAMDWIIGLSTRRGAGAAPSLASAVSGSDAVEGLSGLIVLGAAWESVDVFAALAHAIDEKEKRPELAYFAYLRSQELLRSGRRSLTGYHGEDARLLVASALLPGGVFGNDSLRAKEHYSRLRANAEGWQKNRTAFLLARLRAGRHPDTDPAFWEGYSEVSPLALPPTTAQRVRTFWRAHEQGLTGFLVCAVFAAVFGLAALKGSRRQRQTAGLGVLVLALTLAPQAAHSCLNDRDSDSLEYEAQAFPDTVAVITGRFERNPPLFYEMRLARITREIVARPDDLPLYDDAAVACDRLGRDDEAIAWIEKKRTRLSGTPPSDPRYKEAWYRYYANFGTFRAHRWLRAGANRARITEMKQARDEIAQAVRINPDAHLGREWAQLQTMNWIIDASPHDALYHNPIPLGKYLEVTSKRQNRSTEEVIKALSGLVVQGNAWESVDVFAALTHELSEHRDAKVAFLAELRTRELLRAGRGSLYRDTYNTNTEDQKVYSLARPYWRKTTNQATVRRKFAELRAEADAWHRSRTAYMTARLQAGRHPDTDTTFWTDYHPATPPSLAVPFRDEAGENFGNWSQRAFVHISGMILLLVVSSPIWLLVGAGIIALRRWAR